MIVYSKKIIQFIQEIKLTIKNILTNEVGLKVYGGRFYDRLQRSSYPIKVVVYNNKTMLGYFKSDFYELGFHECLMHSSKQQLHDVIRHELAHYVTFIDFGESVHSHGPEFREFCRRMGWGEKIYGATTCLDGGGNDADMEKSSVFRKVQKLLALATSSNPHEAEQAMIKSQQLLLKHNIESTYFGTEDEEKMFLSRIMKQKREDGKMRCIAKILETYFVSVVYSRAGDFTYLEILGNAINIEIAEYVAMVLQSELDNLWKQAQKLGKLKGMVAKNSFFMGIARGYCNKIQALKRDYDSAVTNALMVLEKQLLDAKAMAYPRLASKTCSGGYCQESSALGEQMGRQLNINTAVGKSNNQGSLIGYST